MKKVFLLLAVMLTVQRLPAQTADNSLFQPLFLYTNGPGRIYPAYNGERLRVGGRYTIEAVPDRGDKFAYWQPVNIITSTLYLRDQDGNVVTNVETDVIPVDTNYVTDRVLTFRIPPAVVISLGTNNGAISLNEGWQANFVPWYQPLPRLPREHF